MWWPGTESNHRRQLCARLSLPVLCCLTNHETTNDSLSIQDTTITLEGEESGLN